MGLGQGFNMSETRTWNIWQINSLFRFQMRKKAINGTFATNHFGGYQRASTGTTYYRNLKSSNPIDYPAPRWGQSAGNLYLLSIPAPLLTSVDRKKAPIESKRYPWAEQTRSPHLLKKFIDMWNWYQDYVALVASPSQRREPRSPPSCSDHEACTSDARSGSSSSRKACNRLSELFAACYFELPHQLIRHFCILPSARL